MQYPVPQFIEVEDKIIGPLTLRQFLTLIAGGVVCLIAWSLADLELFILITLVVGIVSVAFAFVKVNGRLLNDYLASMLGYFTKPQIRTWAKLPAEPNVEFRKTEKASKLDAELTRQGFSESKLKRLAFTLDSYGQNAEPIGTEEEIREEADNIASTAADKKTNF